MPSKSATLALAAVSLLALSAVSAVKADPNETAEKFPTRYNYQDLSTEKVANPKTVLNTRPRLTAPIKREVENSNDQPTETPTAETPVKRETGDSTGIFQYQPKFKYEPKFHLDLRAQYRPEFRSPATRNNSNPNGVFYTGNEFGTPFAGAALNAWAYKHVRLGTFLYCDSDQGDPKDYTFLGKVRHDDPESCYLAQ